MKTHYIPTAPLPVPATLEVPAPPAIPEMPAEPLMAALPLEPVFPVLDERRDEGPSAQEVPAVEGEEMPGEPVIEDLAATQSAEDAPMPAPVERAALSDDLTMQPEIGAAWVREGATYTNALEWMARNGLAYDKTVVLRGYPSLGASWPCSLGTAMLYAAFLAGENRPFEILLPEADEPLLVGGDESGRLYGVTQVGVELTRLYEVQRMLYLMYQAKFPVKLTLGDSETEGNIAEIFVVQLGQMLDAAHERTKRAQGSLAVMDLIGVAVAVALGRAFGGLVPLDKLGSLLQDTERMRWLQENANDLLDLRAPLR